MGKLAKCNYVDWCDAFDIDVAKQWNGKQLIVPPNASARPDVLYELVLNYYEYTTRLYTYITSRICTCVLCLIQNWEVSLQINLNLVSYWYKTAVHRVVAFNIFAVHLRLCNTWQDFVGFVNIRNSTLAWFVGLRNIVDFSVLKLY